jgi:hypothetical protein
MKRTLLTRTALLLTALAAACSDDKSFVVVSVFSSVHSIANAAQLRVNVTDGTNSEQLLYPESPRSPTTLLQLGPAIPVTFSMSFRSTFKDDVTFDVQAIDGTQAALGSGTSSPQPLRAGQVTYATVDVHPSCQPMASAATCTCALVCDNYFGPETLCFGAGQGKPGDSCTDITDCAPGSACFEFTACSTAVQPLKTCRQLCNTDSDCGVASRSFCNTSVSCDQTSTSLRICSHPCDPTGDATLGCAPGLLCFIYPGEITDCACLAPSRAGAVGISCATDEDCLPGLMCVYRGSQGSCQAICRWDNPICAGAKTCTRLTNPDYQVYGACL